MPPAISFKKTTLSYPIVAASFDPYRGYLVTGGGGGAGRSGVGNKITLLDVVSSGTELINAAEIDLSRDEDAVTSVATLGSKDSLIAFAGINSSDDARVAGKNEHFRSFVIDLPKTPKAEKGGKITFSGKTRLFASPKQSQGQKEAYQRIVRLSRPKKTASGSKRIGAIATSLGGSENEIVLFNATVSLPQAKDVIRRITPHDGLEPSEVDILETESGEFLVAYSLDHDVYLAEVPYDFEKRKLRKEPSEPRVVYRIPHPDVFEKKPRSKIRSIRFLSDTHILLLINLPNKSGVELAIVRLYSRVSIGSVVQRKKLPRHVKAAVDLDTVELNADEAGARQIVIAVAGADTSLSLYSIQFNGSARDDFSKLTHYHTLRDVHPFGITKAVFQSFHSPWPLTAPKKGEKPKIPGPQYLRLASTSFGNTVVVDTFPLSPRDPKRYGSPYVLETTAADYLFKPLSVLTVGVVLLVTLMILQGFVGAVEPGTSPNGIQRVLSVLNRSPPGASFPAVASSFSSFRDVKENIAQHRSEGKAIVIHAPGTSSTDDLQTEVHEDSEALAKAHEKAKKWEDLSKSEREKWKNRLIKAGEWAADEGETVLKGVFFSEIGGFIGQVAREAMQ